MRIESFTDASINFISDALAEINQMSNKRIIDTNVDDMKLVIGKNKNRYNIVLMKGRKSISVVQLIHRSNLYSCKGHMICEPHSYTRKPYRGNGYVEYIYRWILDNGIVLRSAHHQSMASHTLWKKLGQEYKLKFFDKSTKTYKGKKSLYEPTILMELSIGKSLVF